MKCLLSVCLSVLAGVAIFAASKPGQSPALQRGISVQMAPSNHAMPMPEADQENAWIVTVTSDGQVYFGTDQVTVEGLAEQMKIHPRSRDAKLYVKADAGAPFNSVRQVLHAARVDLFDDVVLLTAQPETAQPGTIVPPKGLDVWVGSEAASNFVAIQIGTDQGSATMKVDNETVAPSALQGRLAQLFDNRAGRIIVLKASGQVTFARLVQAIDACQGAGASRVTVIVAGEV
ncbi:MAG: ExbD/TolR family protein [Candidatus Sulfotelmatobacter sp.]